MGLNLPIVIGDTLAGKDDAGGFFHPTNMRSELGGFLGIMAERNRRPPSRRQFGEWASRA
jgi:hypothetical protein